MANNWKKNWYKKYAVAKEYYERHGNLDVPKIYPTETIDLGRWINLQRKLYKEGKFTGEWHKCVALLNDIGMIWDVEEHDWNVNFKHAKKYYDANGNIDVEKDYVEGANMIGPWIHSQRRDKANGRITDENKVTMLNDIHAFDHTITPQWEDMYAEAKAYYEENHHLLVPFRYASATGVKIGYWICAQRNANKNGRLPNDRKQKLDEIGMVWDVATYQKRQTMQAVA